MNYTRLVRGGIISTNPLSLRRLTVTPDGTTNCKVTVHDGQDPSAPIIATVRAPLAETVAIPFPSRALFSSGVYVSLDVNTEEVVIFWDMEGTE